MELQEGVMTVNSPSINELDLHVAGTDPPSVWIDLENYFGSD